MCSSPIKHIIISRTDNMGDVVLTLPLVGFLKKQLKDVKITFLGKAYTKAVIEICQYVDNFLDKKEVIENPKLLSAQRAQVIVFAFPDKAVARAAYRANIPCRIGTSHRWFHWWYVNKQVNFSRKKSNLHEAQLNFKLLKPLGISQVPDTATLCDYYGLHVPTAPQIITDTKKINLIIHPKSKGSAREWGLDNYSKLIGLLAPKKFNVYITGTKEEGKSIKKIAPAFFEPKHVKDRTGKFNLKTLIQFIGQADGLVAGSTGPLHLCAALGKFALGLYTPMRPINPGRWSPIGKKAAYLCKDIICKACKKSNNCSCIQEISPDEVWQKLRTTI